MWTTIFALGVKLDLQKKNRFAIRAKMELAFGSYIFCAESFKKAYEF